MTIETSHKHSMMLAFEEVNWAAFVPEDERPLEFVLRKNVPAYLAVSQAGWVVYQRRKFVLVRGDIEGLTNPAAFVFRYPPINEACAGAIKLAPYDFVGFDPDISFVRIEEDVLVDIDRLGFGTARRFSEGIALRAQYEGNPFSFRTRKYLGKRMSSLNRVQFEEAFIVDREKFDSERRSLFDAPDPKEFVIDKVCRKGEIHFLSDDIESFQLEAKRLMAERHQKLADYPFDHQKRMPGIYWMFQAAYAMNELHSSSIMLSRDGSDPNRDWDAGNWLKERAVLGTFSHHSYRTASKFVRLKLSRKKGGKNGKGSDRGEFDLNEIAGLEWLVKDVGKYKFEFASEGLSFILAIADWWYDLSRENPAKTSESLREKLRENGFDGGEVEHLLYLIGGYVPTKTRPKGLPTQGF